MPHKFFELHVIKTYTHRTIAELYVNRQMHYAISCIHTEIIVNTYMHHIQAIPINIKTFITIHRINP